MELDFANTCPECGKPFKPRLGKTYCSHKCRSKAFIKRAALEGKQSNNLTMKNLSVSSEYVTYLIKQAEFWQNKFIDLNNSVQEEDDEKKGGSLGGIMTFIETPAGQNLLGSGLKLIEGWGEILKGRALQGQDNPMLAEITRVYLSFKPETQETIYQFFEKISSSTEEDAMNQLKSFLGESIVNSVPAKQPPNNALVLAPLQVPNKPIRNDGFATSATMFNHQ